jgi:hypothetical protein
MKKCSLDSPPWLLTTSKTNENKEKVIVTSVNAQNDNVKS